MLGTFINSQSFFGSSSPIEASPLLAELDAIVPVDGTFLQRPEHAGGWDVIERGIARGADLAAPSVIVYRRAIPDDAAAIANVHVVSW